MGGHSTTVKGINVSGAVMLNLDLADDGASDPFFFDDPVAAEATPVLTPPEQQDAFETCQGASELFETATEGHPDSGVDSQDEGATPEDEAGQGKENGGKNWRALAASVSLAHAAQKAQKEKAKHCETLHRQESVAGQGPFAGVDLEPQEGMECIGMLVCPLRSGVLLVSDSHTLLYRQWHSVGQFTCRFWPAFLHCEWCGEGMGTLLLLDGTGLFCWVQFSVIA